MKIFEIWISITMMDIDVMKTNISHKTNPSICFTKIVIFLIIMARYYPIMNFET